MKTRPRWQSLLIAYAAITGMLLIPLFVINRWLNMPSWGIVLFAAIVSGLLLNKFFAQRIF